MKAGVDVCKYLPVWSREELESAKAFDLEGKYEYCGGVPRSYRNTIETTVIAQRQASRMLDPSIMRCVELTNHCPSELVKLDINIKLGVSIGLSPVSMSAERLLQQSHFTGVSKYYHHRVQCSKDPRWGIDTKWALEKWFMFWVRGSTTTALARRGWGCVEAAFTCDIENVSNGVTSMLTISPHGWVQAEGTSFQDMLDTAKSQIDLEVGQSVFVQPKLSHHHHPVADLLLFTKAGDSTWEVDVFQVTVEESPASDLDYSTDLFSTDKSGCKLRRFIWVELTSAAPSNASPSGETTDDAACTATTDDVREGVPRKDQYRLNMTQLVPGTS
eukprot:TRINITY_DN19286_c0_g4_i1.p1 TRINITY_DN19286_c0_g4~~TRINITY_DN19286_c0_g4_i1.p1  ORF type:complete len:330 (-),score=21.26 TRINITY_DN19286_c0_g4_i1:100-1089(-)